MRWTIKRAASRYRSTRSVARVDSFGCTFVELTGGEPLEQEGAFELMTQLCDRGYTVAVETGGHVDISRVDSRVIVILDIKCPASGMTKKNRLANLEYLKPTDEVKFVIADREDYEWARDLMKTERIGSAAARCCFHRLRLHRAAISRDGYSTTVCASACNCSCTNSSGIPIPAGCSTRGNGATAEPVRIARSSPARDRSQTMPDGRTL
jgi:hypothetical protein